MKRTPPPILLSAPLVLGAALLSLPAGALPIIDVSLSAGLNHSRMDSWFYNNEPENTSPESFTGTEPRLTLNASIMSWLGLELGWSKLGSSTATLTMPPPPIVGGQPVTLATQESGSAFWLAYAPSIRFTAFELTGKFGAARLKRERAVGPFISNQISDTEVFYGVAGTYWFKDTVGVRLDAERIGSDVAQMGVSLTIGF